MKTIPPPCPEPEIGRKYWRSLDQLADTPEFRKWVEREFPAGASELTDPVTRRHFVKIMSASFMLAGVGLTGCRRPEEHIYPFGKMPENYIHGVPQYYATAMPNRGSAIPLLAKSHDGRPIKVEGNPEHPDNRGGTDHFAQASILNLYDPDRAKRFARNGADVTREAALDALTAIASEAQANGGQGLSFLAEQSSSPSRLRLQKLIAEKYPKSTWHTYEPIDFDVHRRAATAAFGKSVAPYYNFDQARLIVSLDCDFLGSEQDASLHIRRFAQGRDPGDGDPTKPDQLNRLYAVEGLMTLTGANADHRLRLNPSAVLAVAARLAALILQPKGQTDALDSLQRLAGPALSHERWIAECAKDLLDAQNAGRSLIIAGHGQPIEVHLIANALNSALGNIGKTVVFHDAPETKEGSLADLAKALTAGQVQTLVMLGGNPSYNAPVDVQWDQAQRKAKTLVRLGFYEDETFFVRDSAQTVWHLPLAHYLESWGDARTADGTFVSIQPLIEPLFGGLTEIEVSGRIAGVEKLSSYEIVRDTFRTLAGGNEETWKKYLHDGFLPKTAAQPANVQFGAGVLARAVSAAKPLPSPTPQQLEVVFHRDYSVDDGRYNNNGWLQELPDPITKVTWENVILLSAATAKALGVYFEDPEGDKLFAPVARVELGRHSIEGPVWIQPGQVDNVIGLALGYGRRQTGRVGRNAGYDANRLRTTAAANIAAGAKLSATGQKHELATTQGHWSMEGRPIVREANLQQYKKHPDFPKSMNLEEPAEARPLYPNPLDAVRAKGQGIHQWGMSIDLNRCVGCSACMVACQSENNIPIVGKEQVGKSREMHWIRIDRYYTADPAKPRDEQLNDPQVLNQPMLCQHCEKAPCESVCPVNATTHDEEGLNLMVYNRCVGTRYCSNNCPYKVRRFNYFDYNRRPLDQLYKSPLDPFNRTDGEWEFKRWLKDVDRGSRPEDEWELVKLVKNPDVTVRMRGVMEKCTFCVQRLEQAKIAQKVKVGASPDVRLTEKDGNIPKTACQQACPAEAIVFGDISDPESKVSKLKNLSRDYTVLEFLSTKPRLTYLARVRNPNTSMPDYHEWPLSVKENFPGKTGDPFEAHEAGAHETAKPAQGEQKGAH